MKPINIEKNVVVSEAQDILYQPNYDIDIPPPEPTQISTVPDLNPSVTKGIGTHIGYQGGSGRSPQVFHHSLDLEARNSCEQ